MAGAFMGVHKFMEQFICGPWTGSSGICVSPLINNIKIFNDGTSESSLPQPHNTSGSTKQQQQQSSKKKRKRPPPSRFWFPSAKMKGKDYKQRGIGTDMDISILFSGALISQNRNGFANRLALKKLQTFKEIIFKHLGREHSIDHLRTINAQTLTYFCFMLHFKGYVPVESQMAVHDAAVGVKTSIDQVWRHVETKRLLLVECKVHHALDIDREDTLVTGMDMTKDAEFTRRKPDRSLTDFDRYMIQLALNHHMFLQTKKDYDESMIDSTVIIMHQGSYAFQKLTSHHYSAVKALMKRLTECGGIKNYNITMLTKRAREEEECEENEFVRELRETQKRRKSEKGAKKKKKDVFMPLPDGFSL